MQTLFGKRIRTHLLPVVMACALTACGAKDSHDGPAVYTGSITITPSSNSISVGPAVGCVGLPGAVAVIEWPYLVTVFDEQGRPVGNAEIEVGIDFAANTVLGLPVVAQLIDRETGLVVSDIGDPLPYTTVTDEFGNHQFYVIFEVTTGCQYRGQFSVVSGSLVQQADFDTTD